VHAASRKARALPLRGRKVADNYFNGRANRTKSEINHATTRIKKQVRVEGQKGGVSLILLAPLHPPPLIPPFSFATAVFAPMSPRRMSTLPFLRLTQMRGRQHTFNSLLILQLLLLPPPPPSPARAIHLPCISNAPTRV